MAFKLNVPAVLTQKKILIPLAILIVVLLVVLTILLLPEGDAKTEQTPPEESESSSTSSTETASESAPPAEPVQVTLTGVNINNLDMCIVVPAEIKDPNIPENKVNRNKPVTTFSNGNRTEVALHFSDNIITKETLPVLYLQAFAVGDNPPEQVTYVVETGVKTTQNYTYSEISDKVVYSANGTLVLDVTAFQSKTPQEAMESYIAKSQGKQLARPENVPLTGEHLLADGTYVYKYDWMHSAADYVRGHIADIILPIQYATPYSLDALGYVFEMSAAPQTPPYLVAVSSATVKSTKENGHSGVYSTVVYGGERLLGDYTVLQPAYIPAGDTLTNPSSFSLLQAFKRDDLERPDAAIKFLRRNKPKKSSEDYYQIYSEGPFSEFSLTPELLESYVVFRDDDIVVYNFLDFAKPPSLEEQLEYLADSEGYEQYGIETKGVTARQNAILSAEGGIGRFIRKKA